jgi:tRNA threonylcarbamoyladenosine biosynthesis protein TsaB
MTLREARGMSERVTDALESLLRIADAEREEIRAIGVTRGPGAFTALRVGLAAAQGLARALGVPCWGFSSLEALALAWPEPERPVLALLDARREQLYAGLYGPQVAGRRPILRDEAAIGLEQVAEWADALGAGAVVGDGAWVWPDRLSSCLDGGASVAPDAAELILAAPLARMAWARLAGGSEAPDPDNLRPVYLRPALTP